MKNLLGHTSLTHYFSKSNADQGIYTEEISEKSWLVVSVNLLAPEFYI